MQCSQCQHENPEDARFCNACGVPLGTVCPACGHGNLSGSRFCNACGQSLLASASQPGPSSTPDSAPSDGDPVPDAERRQLTVMFCDLSDSTKLSGLLDPEDLRQVIRSYQQTCVEVIQRFAGCIARYMGDGLLVYFGYPQAHDDDAQRAVRAGLAIVSALPTLNARLGSYIAFLQTQPLQVRIGIHTGLVVIEEIGEGLSREHQALGETPNLAARLQGIARPDTVVISTASMHLVGGYFDCDDLGLHPLRGVAELQQVYRVRGERDVDSRFEAATVSGLTPLVGREEELSLLWRRWQQAMQRQGQVVLISGEPGIGKSRLAEVLREHVSQENTGRIIYRCSPYHTNSALYPVIESVQRLMGRQRHDPPEIHLDKLERLLQTTFFPLHEIVPLMAALLSVPLLGRYALPRLTPERQRQRTLDTLVTWLLRETTRHPVLLICEDLHWADPSTLEMLSLLIERTPTARLLVLMTFRPTFHPPWPMAAHLTSLALNRFTPQQIESMATQVAGGKFLPSEIMPQLVGRSDGVPLFVEEVTRVVLESGVLREVNGHYELVASLSTLAIPATLHDSLTARLDRLVSAKGVAQLAAAIGRQFSYEILQAVAPLDERALQRELDRLVEAEILYQRGLPPQSTYTFKHALIQDAAYQALLKSTRQQYHRRIAEVLAERFPDTLATQPELLAHHYTEAGLTTQALDAWQRAGRLASERSAHLEAVAHLTRGLARIEHLPDLQERVQRELPLQLTLGATLVKAKGHGSPEVEQAYARARVLSQQMGDSPRLVRVLYGLMGYYLNRAAHQTGLEVAQQLLAVAQRQQNRAQLLMAHNAMGTMLYYHGEFSRAYAHLEQGIALHDDQPSRAEDRPGAFIPRVANLFYAAWTLWPLGYPEQALSKCREALALAREWAHPFSITMTLLFISNIYCWCRDLETYHEHTEAACALATENEFTWWLAWATVDRGAVLAARGQFEDGIAQMQAGLTAWRNHGSEAGRPAFLHQIAQAYGQTGQVDKGMRVLAEALALVDQTQERYWEAELHRLKGEFLLLQVGPDAYQAEACFQQALAVARRQQAKSLELRAATSLARLWQSQGKRQDACALLAPVYGWFTEGFDTADLKDAKALLAALRG